MKKDIFSWVFALIIYVLLVGWIWLPNSAVYVDFRENHFKYSIFSVWANVAGILLLVLALSFLVHLGGLIYEYLRK